MLSELNSKIPASLTGKQRQAWKRYASAVLVASTCLSGSLAANQGLLPDCASDCNAVNTNGTELPEQRLPNAILDLERLTLQRFIERHNRSIPQHERQRLISAIITESELLRLPAHFRIGRQPLNKLALLTAFIRVESTFTRTARSSSDARGYMQLKPATVAWLDKKMGYQHGSHRLFESQMNLRKGARYINHLAELMPDLRRTVLAYNAGPGSVKRGRWKESYWLRVRTAYMQFLTLQRTITAQNRAASLNQVATNP
ncbi:MAG: lytic transglycosylase domain-containing protein [Leptospiraceae bacterium]|nr:lytic transglycosylase domain-containing protein [Leptospiraceae bacterium]